jgi:hypothetical protein
MMRAFRVFKTFESFERFNMSNHNSNSAAIERFVISWRLDSGQRRRDALLVPSPGFVVLIEHTIEFLFGDRFFVLSQGLLREPLREPIVGATNPLSDIEPSGCV